MTTAVYRMVESRLSRDSLVCHLRSTTPQEAIERLLKHGVFAVEGVEPQSIVLVGYSYECRVLLANFRQFDWLTSHSVKQRLREKLARAV